MATTSGTSTFNLDILQIAEEAFERAGLEMRTGYDLRTARRSLSLMALEWANRGLNLWTVESGTQALTSGTSSYTLDADLIDLLEHYIRTGSGTSQVDYQLERVSVSTYAHQTNKNIQGRPTQIYLDRGTDQITAHLWPVPDSSDYTLGYYAIRRMEDLGANTNNFDAPERLVPALAAGLAFHIASKRLVGAEAAQRVPALKAYYDEQLMYAFQEDRDDSDWRLVPYRYRI